MAQGGNGSTVFFDSGSSRTTSSCTFGGRPGTCKQVIECPELLAYAQSGNVTALEAAISTCGNKLVPGKQDPVQLLCCPEGRAAAAPRRVQFQNHPLCGASVFAPGRIVGGEPVQRLAEFPWMAALKWSPSRSIPQYRCGGAVINERWVLTAGHCITDGGPVSVRVRDLNLASTSEDSFSEPPIDVPVERLFRHPGYRRRHRAPNRGLFNDIALIKLSSDLQFSDISKPLCLPEGRRSTRDYEQLDEAYIAGWGLTEFAGEASTRMLWAKVNISNHRTCQTSYARTGNRIDDSEHLCASGNDLKQEGCVPGADAGSCRGGVDACEGDSGGPLMERRRRLNRRRWYAIGVVSFGTGCGNPDFPGLYSRVDHFLDWIAETVADN